jgi:hypothetical protein
MLRLTLMLMKRDRNNTVTAIPVLIQCSPDEQEGEATFSEFAVPVRAVTEKDFDTKTGRHKKFLNAMQDHERQHFAGVVGLLKGIQERDPIRITKARRQLSEAHATEARRAQTLRWKGDAQFGHILAPFLGLEVGQGKEASEILSGQRLPPRIAKDDAKVLSLEISRTIALQVNLVLWWTGTQFTPALFCSDPKLALYVYILTHKGLGVCPHCGDFFPQQRPDQNYCSIPHREAHRVARWRAKKLSESTKKGGQRGPRKAR